MKFRIRFMTIKHTLIGYTGRRISKEVLMFKLLWANRLQCPFPVCAGNCWLPLTPPFPRSRLPFLRRKKIIPPRNPPFLHHLDCTTPYTWFSPLLRDPRRLFVVVVVIVVAVVVASKWYKMCEMSHSLSFSLSLSLSLSLSRSLCLSCTKYIN